MMEKFQQDLDEWERRHQQTWLGRHAGDLGTGISAQFDLMSPTGILDYSRDPSLFNLAKAAYSPAIAYGGYSWVAYVTGSHIGIAQRIAHTADMTRQTIHAVGRPVLSGVASAVRRTPGMIAMAVLYGAGHLLQDMYHGMSGMYIGDIRFSR